MPALDLSLAFFFSSLLLAIAPGPDNIFVLTQSALFGVRAGIITTLGLMGGLVFHTIAVAAGVAALVMSSQIAFNLLKICGAAYLLWLAWLSLQAKPVGTGKTDNFIGYAALFRRGIIMNITNPKVLMFFLAFLPQFCRPGLWPYSLQITFFGFLFMLAAFLIFCAISLLGGKLALWFNRSPNSQILIHRIAAAIFAGLALTLIFTDASP